MQQGKREVVGHGLQNIGTSLRDHFPGSVLKNRGSGLVFLSAGFGYRLLRAGWLEKPVLYSGAAFALAKSVWFCRGAVLNPIPSPVPPLEGEGTC